MPGDAPVQAGSAGLMRFFRPGAIAVVGASERPGSVGRDVMENLVGRGFSGPLYPVNPKYKAVLGHRCLASLADLPEPVDVVAIAVPAKDVAAVIREAGAAGAGMAVVFASGFAEAGEDGARHQAEVVAAAEASGVRVLGPNCQGFMNITEDIRVGFGPPYKFNYLSNGVGAVSQSGAFGNSVLIGLSAEGVGVRYYASTGNEANVTALSLIEAMLDDAENSVIAAYVEGLRDAHRLREVAGKASRLDKPLVIWKVGRSHAASKAAASHTASLSGDDRIYRAAFRQFGIVDVDDIGDMADCIRALETGRKTQGPRIGVVTVSGGAGVVMADQIEDRGLRLADFSEDTIAELRQVLPRFASFANPLDVTAAAVMEPKALEVALEVVARDPGVDMLALAFAGASGEPGVSIAQAVGALYTRHVLPITVAWNVPYDENAQAYDLLRAARVPVYASPARAIRGLAAVWCARRAVMVSGTAPPTVRASTLLNEVDSKRHIARLGIPGPREDVVTSASAARKAAAKIGFPVVVKLLSSHLGHKSELGGVRVGLRDAADVGETFDEIAAIPGAMVPPLPFEGVLVQEQVRDGTEVLLGARVDSVFGPIVMIGAGGVHAEIFEDVAIRLAPITLAEARAMIGETRISRVLEGIRGSQPRDAEALAEAVVRFAEAIAEPSGKLQEIEINPLFVMPRGSGIVAGDCVVRTAKEERG